MTPAEPLRVAARSQFGQRAPHLTPTPGKKPLVHKNGKTRCSLLHRHSKIGIDNSRTGRSLAKERGAAVREDIPAGKPIRASGPGAPEVRDKSLPSRSDPEERSKRRVIWRARNSAVSGGSAASQAAATKEGTPHTARQAAGASCSSQDAGMLSADGSVIHGTRPPAQTARRLVPWSVTVIVPLALPPGRARLPMP